MKHTSNAADALEALLSKFDPDQLANELIALGDDWADKNAAASGLEEKRKSKLAALTLEFMEGTPADGGKKLSAAASEVKALADARYMAHVDEMVEARKRAHKARVRYETSQNKIELTRSLIATHRAELRAISS
jgi:hypothetical protein